MSDELRRRFQDKIQGRPVPARRAHAAAGSAGIPPDTLVIHDIEHGEFAAALPLNPLFRSDRGRLRLTLDLGIDLRRRALSPTPAQRESFLSFAPRLDHHDCCLGVGLDSLLAIGSAPPSRAPAAPDDADGLPLAHLVEHLALELIADATGGRDAHGATCAHADLPERFDLYLEVSEPLLARTAAILSAAVARDVCAGLDRLDLHLRSRDLLIALATGSRTVLVPEDVASEQEWTTGGAREALDALVRIGYLESRAAAFTFSSASGVIYRRAEPAGGAASS